MKLIIVCYYLYQKPIKREISDECIDDTFDGVDNTIIVKFLKTIRFHGLNWFFWMLRCHGKLAPQIFKGYFFLAKSTKLFIKPIGKELLRVPMELVSTLVWCQKMRCQFHTRCVAVIDNNKKKSRFRKCGRLTMGGKGPPTCLVNTRHRARFSYKLYTDRASDVACGCLDARRQHKGPIYAATRTGHATGHRIMLRSLFMASV